jgi:hypothetical protein
VKGLLKIGYTNLKRNDPRDIMDQKDIKERLAAIASECGRTPILIDDINQRPIKEVYRAEQLIFARLSNVRLVEEQCRGSGCGSHQEWFEVDVSTAFEIIESTRKWIEEELGVVKTGIKEIYSSPPSPVTVKTEIKEISLSLSSPVTSPAAGSHDTESLCRRLQQVLGNISVPTGRNASHCIVSREDLAMASSLVDSILVSCVIPSSSGSTTYPRAVLAH